MKLIREYILANEGKNKHITYEFSLRTFPKNVISPKWAKRYWVEVADDLFTFKSINALGEVTEWRCTMRTPLEEGVLEMDFNELDFGRLVSCKSLNLLVVLDNKVLVATDSTSYKIRKLRHII